MTNKRRFAKAIWAAGAIWFVLGLVLARIQGGPMAALMIVLGGLWCVGATVLYTTTS